MEHAFHLFLLIIVARLFGEISERLGQPALIGEIVAGITLGLLAMSPLTIDLIDRLPSSPFLEIAAEYGIFFVVLVAGMEMRPSEIVSQSMPSLAVAVGGVVLPLAAGFALAWAFLPDTSLRLAQALLVGVALSISAIPVAVRVLQALNLLHDRVGHMIVSAAIFDDVIGLALLAIVLGVIETGAVPDAQAVFLLLGKVALFFGITVGISYFILPSLYRVVRRFQIPALQFSTLMITALGFSFLAEALGMDFILGPFIAGLFFNEKVVEEAAYVRVKQNVDDVTDGLLAPLFFVSIGARVDVTAVAAVPVFLAALIAVAFLGKWIGAGIPARILGFSTPDAVAVGVGMSGRGAVELVVASIALEAGLFDQTDTIVANLFSALVIMAIVTTLAMPIMLRAVLELSKGAGGRRTSGE
tara:strand:- start:192 stop:1436 length:1245 start_codon:yes stop_codon:yes gene_type:complete